MKRNITWKSRTTWREKLENPPKGLPKVARGAKKWEKKFGGRKVLVPTPLLVDKTMRKIQKRKIVTIDQIGGRLAKDFKADSTCPLTTGIFVRIAAEAAEEDRKIGKKQVPPYWRVLKKGGMLNEKFPGGVERQAKRLRAEGHTIIPGKPLRVKDLITTETVI